MRRHEKTFPAVVYTIVYTIVSNIDLSLCCTSAIGLGCTGHKRERIAAHDSERCGTA